MLSPFVFLRVSRNSCEAFLRRKSWFPLHRKTHKQPRRATRARGTMKNYRKAKKTKRTSRIHLLCASFYNSSYQTLIVAWALANVVHAAWNSILLLDYWKASAEKGGSNLGYLGSKLNIYGEFFMIISLKFEKSRRYGLWLRNYHFNLNFFQLNFHCMRPGGAFVALSVIFLLLLHLNNGDRRSSKSEHEIMKSKQS